MGKLHHAMMGTAAVAIASAAAVPGTLVNLAAGGGEREAVRCVHLHYEVVGHGSALRERSEEHVSGGWEGEWMPGEGGSLRFSVFKPACADARVF